MKTSLYLIPVTLGDSPMDRVLPDYNREILSGIRHFIVENERTARRFLKKTDASIDIDGLTFYVLNKHTSPEEIASFLNPLKEGFSMGVLSEAGCPAIADPGSEVVKMAQQKQVPVVPLVGPSSILLSLMASGFNGQQFAFSGYLPIDPDKRIQEIKRMEKRIYDENQTQIFIETPYRNNKLVEDIVKTCKPSIKLCIAANITCENEFIRTRGVKEWQGKVPDLSKQPCIFLLYR
ncbi:MAG: SAM-dependent methyltransferase [Dysgonamonadaceae bacterium]|jgi:16S rRNA (cytidine1402-2'-O)-methyltransferase|nr:SAM-dependent methyltransferase [Dysgonamonadaceae bacterium]